MVRRRQLMGMQNPSRLPKEYQEVEYIGANTSTRIQSYILTGVSGNNKTIEVKYERTSTVANGPIIVASYNSANPSNIIAPWAAANGRVGGAGTTITPQSSTIYVPQIYTIEFKTTTAFIRMGGWSDTVWTAAFRYYYFRVFDENGLIFDGVPCYRKSDNKTGLYDLVGQTFVPNSGTAEFILGDKV